MEKGYESELTGRFASEIHKTFVNVLYTAAFLSIRAQNKLKPFGITLQQFNILRILRGQYPGTASVNLLVQRMIDKSSNASRLVDRLEEKGLVSRNVNSKDKRSVDVIITAKGLDVLNQIDEKEGNLERDIISISEEEAITLNRLLDKFRKAAVDENK